MQKLITTVSLAMLLIAGSPVASAGEILWGSCYKDNTALCPVNVNHGSCRVNFYQNDNVGEIKYRVAIQGESCFEVMKDAGTHLAVGASAIYYGIKATPCWRCR